MEGVKEWVDYMVNNTFSSIHKLLSHLCDALLLHNIVFNHVELGQNICSLTIPP